MERIRSFTLFMLAAVLAFLPSSRLFAEDELDLLPKHLWETSYEIFWFDYEQEFHGEETEIDGIMNGLRVAYTSHSARGPMFRLEGSFSYGQLDIDGHSSEGASASSDTEDFLIRLQGVLGYDFRHGNSVSTIYTGLAYRYWNDDVDDGGYESEFSQFFWPVGYELAVPLGSKWVVGGGADVKLLLGGKVTSHLSQADSTYEDAENNQDGGSGYGIGSNMYLRRATGRFPWSAGIFANYYNIEKTDADVVDAESFRVVGLVPGNETLEVGLRLSLYW